MDAGPRTELPCATSDPRYLAYLSGIMLALTEALPAADGRLQIPIAHNAAGKPVEWAAGAWKGGRIGYARSHTCWLTIPRAATHGRAAARP